jgi:hypothetical protein
MRRKERDPICHPATKRTFGVQPSNKTDEQRLETRLCTYMVDPDKPFDQAAACRDSFAAAAASCRNGTQGSMSESDCAIAIRRGGNSTSQVATVEPGGGTGAAPTTRPNGVQSVPGGSTSGTCDQVIRAVASGSSAAGSSAQIADCVGTTDVQCQQLRAKAALGYNVFPLPADVQQRCFS